MGGDWQGAWNAALDELEADVSEVEAMLADDHRMRDNPLKDDWKPPAGLGPLPLDLRPRADAILDRQMAAAKAVALTIATNRRQAAVAARIEVGQRGAPRPAYVDCAMRRPGRNRPRCRQRRPVSGDSGGLLPEPPGQERLLPD